MSKNTEVFSYEREQSFTFLHISLPFFSFWDVSNLFVDRTFASGRIDSHNEPQFNERSILMVTSEIYVKIENENFDLPKGWW